MPFYISPRTRAKLDQKHGGVSEAEIEEAFANRDGAFLVDTREEHKTNPPTEWFIAQTDRGRLLKVVFVNRGSCVIEIKSAYPPELPTIQFYERKAK